MKTEPQQRILAVLEERRDSGLLRRISVFDTAAEVLNLAGNDYLDLARDPAVIEAACAATRRYGASSSASPLITGYTEAHRNLEERLCSWHRSPAGLIWNGGFTANQAVLSRLPQKGDLVLADRLVHHSMISGILRSGARLQRYRHLDLDHLESLLQKAAPSERTVFVVTESVFSMDGDSPDLSAMAGLKAKYGFFWIVDEAHATGWYGPEGAGLLTESGGAEAADVIVGTLGKALGSQGAYTLFRDVNLREFLINTAGEFIYSTYLAPACAAAAAAAIERARDLAAEQPGWRAASSGLRKALAADGWRVPPGDSPIVPLMIGGAEETMALETSLSAQGLRTGAVRPPTVPEGSSRLRLSLKRTLREEDHNRIRDSLTRASQAES